MTITYKKKLLQSDFEGADYDISLEFNGNELYITAGYSDLNYATLTLEQFERVAIEVERFKKMLSIETLDSKDF